ncbi:unnamed protein product, partial [Effrenium voratum]
PHQVQGLGSIRLPPPGGSKQGSALPGSRCLSAAERLGQVRAARRAAAAELAASAAAADHGAVQAR